ncbi:hypothetical protein ACSFA2_17625 [Variovorax sp. LT2P21]|uniref:hypothetical protein n=1 Tax=Variovorax sp. LT2P21 TaxID=3443731 RepID=UPI003F469246
MGELATRFISEAADAAGVNVTQWLIAFHLEANAPEGKRVAMSPKGLAARMMCPQTRVITQIAAMKRNGLIELVDFPSTVPQPSRSDGRKFYALTIAGLKLIKKSAQDSAAGDELFASLISSKLAIEMTALHRGLEDASVKDCLDSLPTLKTALRQGLVKSARRR